MPPLLVLVTAALFVVIAVTNWVAVAQEDRRTEGVVKPAALLALATAALAGGALDSTAGVWLVVALLLGTAGDVLLLGDSERRFLGGLGAFLVGHLAYVACFATLGISVSWWLAGGAVALAGALVAGRAVLPATFRSGGIGLAAPVAAYMLVIGAMLVTAWGTGLALVAAGAAVFVASDTVLALDRFARPRDWVAPWPHVAVMVTYHLGQALIVVGVLGAA
ncbi:putative membrane protein YhhN [Nocardioides zeae]|uniref:Membrane protein YhhN n=1 Tax=Nocardioides zeae TaxID=1457234 RepID=A0ACC6IFF1_9ACTN|nr:lysoplasmalogenase [Nocardioides zeae]MDR6176465.1 putative membrane protein YhhN [Nocardioides zeae]MDR6209478.1 putative membrane protein YhhN [Nocardioides zeae]